MRYSRTERMVVVLALLAALLACKKFGKKSEGDSESGKAASGDSIGIPECDEYLTKYEKCLKDNVPAAARGAMEGALKQTRDGYKQSAQNAAAKSALASGCKQAMETTKTAMASYNCKW